MRKQEDFDLVVIGAGPTGLTAACEARRLGLSVQIIDRKEHRSTFSKALVVHARTMEVLESMGLSERVRSAGASFDALNAHFGESAPVRMDLRGLDWGDTCYPYWLSIPQYETERCLEEHLNALGGAVRWRTSLESLEQDSEGVSLTLRGPDGQLESLRARWVIGCDGGGSVTRSALGIAMERESLEETFVLADVHTTQPLAEAEGHAWYREGGLVLLVPMPEPGLFRLIAHMPERREGERYTIDEAFLDGLIRDRAGLELGSHDLAWTSQFDLHQGLAGRYRVGRVFLAGDAAHVHSPVGGQGMNTGIQDAHNLLWKLALTRELGQAASELYLDSYQQERRATAKAMVQGTGRATRVLTSKQHLVGLLLRELGPRLASTQLLQEQLGRAVGMLELVYEQSDVLQDLPAISRGLPAPGGRFPNPVLNEATRLHDLLDPLGHTLFLFDGSPRRLSQGGRLTRLDPRWESTLREALGVPGAGVILVRPDRCVAGCWSNLADLESFPPARAVLDTMGAENN